MRSKITLKELAKLLNVSVSTVSKSLNDSSEISPKTIQRVKELAKLHNYKPNPMAVNLKHKRTGNIAVIVPNISNPFFAKVLAGVETEVRSLGFQVITYISNESLQLEQQITELLSNGMVDGLLISVSEETQRTGDYEHLHRLKEYEIPVVLFDRINVDIELDKVGVNDMRSIYNAVSFLYSKNIKKIGLVCAIGEIGLGKQRIEGYLSACKDLNLEMKDNYVVVSEDYAVLKKDLKELLRQEDIEAIIGLDYISTLLASRVVQESNLKIPYDIKIIGYANAEYTEYYWPSISYIDQHPMKMGATATNLLVERIKGVGEKTYEKILETELVHFDSTEF
ncbi:LacI family transcriptional regulator [Gillisia sp. M10.2A]|uniref:LacI family transcriptional regulator n=1 Tax=Gillisia lutea TaxID=2909668 RepID=A0ABS9EEV2_9FLAO|nr:LacI family DNA-binding transcriptional regulator [Gillisia lutea]MCF4100792.1 LacI family transcriptional regulator [Gillisia lutea]